MTWTLRLRVVFARAWPLWIFMLGILVATCVGLSASADGPARVRWAGTILQVLGLATVAAGLKRILQDFHRPSASRMAFDWFRQLAAVLIAPKPRTVQASTTGATMATGRGRTSATVGPDASPERRLAALEENVNRLREDLEKSEREISITTDAIRTKLKALATECLGLKRQLEELAVGGLYFEAVGLAWLILGVVGTGLPDEIARLLSLLF